MKHPERIRYIEIIGEAAGRIQNMAPGFAANHPEMPLIDMRGMRNKMIHGYYDVDLEVVWSTVQQEFVMQAAPHKQTTVAGPVLGHTAYPPQTSSPPAGPPGPSPPPPL